MQASIGRYVIEQTVSSDRFGALYAGVDPHRGRKVMVRSLVKSQPPLAWKTPGAFAREAQAAQALNHPNIVPVYDFGEDDDIAYVVTEAIEGRLLKACLDGGERFDLGQTVRIVRDACAALAFAHGAGVIHGDVHAGNLILDVSNRAKLGGFGIPQAPGEDTPSAAASPEQIIGREVDERTDVFSLGMILYELLAGERPFTGAGAWAIAKKIIQDDPPAPSSLNGDVSSHFDEVVVRALRKSPEERYASVSEFWHAIKGALEATTGQQDFAPEVVIPPSPSPRPKPSRTAERDLVQEEIDFWDAIKVTEDPDDYTLYLEQFPNGRFVELARAMLRKLGRA